MSKTMLIDATHAEETRVVVLNGSKVEEFDFESHARKQLRGNIYLAKVTRVEPSLQAAFVEYGGNRHGFLAFNEIHPDYYQIPVADREKLMAELAQQAAANNADDEDDAHEDDGDDLPDEERRLRAHLIKRYKIQEVIKRRQILLVQVVKEERGNKGAALTTYLSLAGRYCVLMPNTARGGGISRKITNGADRKRLKAVAQSLDVPQGMGLIVRTAGAKRTKTEIKRDYDYLLRVWENIRETTLRSNAPALIYEEEDLVKRAIRDLFDKDFDHVQVEGVEGYKSAKDFMRMIMPSQSKKIQLYSGGMPLFARYGIDEVLNRIYSPVVPLRSGGYLVINQTEALVAIDVNSGKSTKERNIEATALKTNLEAAEEAARQMRLRDLAGLVVIDFIDMDESKNNRAVEKRLKDALSEDRARIQMGKISGFGLMEISRQRRRTGFLEGTTVVCPHCEGMGRVRSTDSSALAAMRAIDMEAMTNGAGAVTIKLPQAVALYVLNEKQAHLAKLRVEWGLKVNVEIDPDLGLADCEIVRTVHADEVDFTPPARPDPIVDLGPDPDYDEAEDEDDEIIAADDDAIEREDTDDDEASERAESREDREDRRGGRGRRRRRRGGRPEGEARVDAETVETEASEGDVDAEGEEDDGDEDGDFRRNRRRRRGRRGGRRNGPDARPREPYAWVRARTPSLEEPYVWIDPFDESQGKRAPNPGETPDGFDVIEVQADVTGTVETTESASVLGAATQAPTSLVPEELRDQPAPKGKRPPRKRRGKAEAEAVEAAVETPVETPEPAVMETALEPVAEIAPEPVVAEPIVEEAVQESGKPVRKTRARKKKTDEPVAEAAPEPVIAAEPEVVETAPEPIVEPVTAPAPEPVLEAASEIVGGSFAPTDPEPDPSEISTPPAKPKRGWWRK
ncbi:ribonuclease E/G [Asticcacaulis sp. AND118]|uniref:Rne/Rng family ribonuclease n=1 Tax=Asticcacaulis sp. AND118 TaxID=2840468 RepID=UPI001CFF7D76|nr:ribonuclease E/G [Asticcacaulis sp. AND118]UDF02235.1 Rne/Rng family ribonuclease [Asticcacaulis sp. AND118]